MSTIVIYYKPTCPYCVRAMELLKHKGQTFDGIDISGNENLREEMIAKAGRHTVPQIFIDDTHVGGCDDLFALEQNGELNRLLKVDNV